MKEAPIPSNEHERLRKLRELKLLDTPSELFFEEMVILAADICKTPIAVVSLVDENRQWFKAKVGITLKETPRRISFCSHAILKEDLFYVSNASTDARFQGNPLVTGNTNIQFYAGYPIQSPSGALLGTLCVMDKRPRRLTKEQKHALKILAGQVSTEIRVRTLIKRQQELIEALEKRENKQGELQQFLFHFIGLLGNELKQPWIGLQALLGEENEGPDFHSFPKEKLLEFQGQMELMLELLGPLRLWTMFQYRPLDQPKQRIDLDAVVREKIMRWQNIAEAKQVVFIYEASHQTAVCDLEVFSMVLNKILQRAIIHSPSGGSVKIVADMHSILVEDKGPVIEPSALKRMFEWGYIESMKNSGGHEMHLSLKLCYELMSHVGGNLSLEPSGNGKNGMLARIQFQYYGGKVP